MSAPDLLKHVERLQRLGTAAAGQIASWSEPQKRAHFVERVVGEASEASTEVLTMLLDGSWRTPREEVDRRIQALLQSGNLSEFGTDAFGYAPEALRDVLPLMAFMYRVWFRAEAHGLQNVPDGRCLIIGNHSGQLPFDAAAIAAALVLERDPPRMPRSMVEKFATAMPWIGRLFSRCGQITGLPDNCRRLLEADECVMVFPEGARGIAKPFRDRYRMTAFGHGFMRLALETGSPIVPVAVVGAEEQTVNLFNIETLAKLAHSPSFPFTPLMPFLGPVAMLPAPVKYRIWFGEPLHFEGDPNDDETVIAAKVAVVKSAIATMLDQGLRERRGIFI